MKQSEITTCPSCGYQTYQVVCQACAHALAGHMEEIPDLVETIREQAYGLHRTALSVIPSGSRSYGSTDLLPADPQQGLRAARDAEHMLREWAEMVLEYAAEPGEEPAPVPDNLVDVASYLVSAVEWAATQYWAGDLLDEVATTAARLRRALYRSSDPREFLGGCPTPGCRVYLYAPSRDTGRVRCHGCGAEHSTMRRRAALRRRAGDLMVTAQQAADMLRPELGRFVSRNRLDEHRRAGVLEPVGQSLVRGKPVHLYRLGDVRSVASRARDEREPRSA